MTLTPTSLVVRTELQWAALHRIWVDAEFGGRREVLLKTRSMYTSVGTPIVVLAPPTAAVPAAAVAAPPWLFVPSDAATAALTATTHVFLAASSTQKRGRPTTAGNSDNPPSLLWFREWRGTKRWRISGRRS